MKLFRALSVLMACTTLNTPANAWWEKAKTAAPPEVQAEIIDFFAMIGSSQHQCRRIGTPKVLSSEISEGAEISPEGALVKGQIFEVWQTRMCGSKIKYRFTIVPDENGALSLHGFEPLN